MPCSCGGGTSAAEKYQNVKGDGTVATFDTKAEALASSTVNGGYVRPLKA